MKNILNKVDYPKLVIANRVFNSIIMSSVNFFTSLFSQLKAIAKILQCGFSAIALTVLVFLLLSNAGVNAQSPVVTIEANPFKESGTEGNSYILIADKKLLEDLIVNYEVIPDTGPPIPKMATIEPTGDNSNVTNTESRVDVTESHTEVRLVAGTGYSLGDPNSAVKIDSPVETTRSAPGVQIKFRQNTVNEGSGATLLARLTPWPGSRPGQFIRVAFEMKLDDGEFIPLSGLTEQSKIIDRVVAIGPVSGFNMATEYQEVHYFFRETDFDLNDITVTVKAKFDARFITGVNNLTFASENGDETSIRVINNDIERLVRIETPTEMINEGEKFPVTITTSRPKPNESIAVEFYHNDHGTGFFDSFEAESPVMLTHGEHSKTIMVNTNELTGPQGDGFINVILRENPNYIIDATKGQVSVKIIDYDAYEVSIESDTTNNTITEGQPANFKVKTEDITIIDLDINIFIDDITSKDFFTWRIPKSVLLPEGETEASFSIQTGTQSDTDGSFSVSIIDGFGYRPIEPSMVEITVEADMDEDIQEQRISVASLVVQNLLSIDTSELNTNSSEAKVLPVISVVADSDSVEEGQIAGFTLVSQSVIPNQLRIYVSISGTSGLIEKVSNQIIVLEANQNQKKFSIPTIDNDRADNDGYVKVAIKPNFGYITGLNSTAEITITDHLDRERRRNELETANREVLSELYHNIGVTSWSNLSNQIELAFADKNEASVILGGQNTINEFLTANAKALDDETWSLQSILGNSSFTFNLNPDNQGNKLGTIWGLGKQQTFSQNEKNSTNSWNADLFTAQFGSDLQLRDNGIAGLSISVSDSSIDFGNEETSAIQYDIQNNYIQSYFGWQFPNQNSTVRAAVGYGIGEIILEQASYNPLYLNSNTYSVAVSGDILLYSSPMLSGRLTNSVSIIGDSFFAQTHISEIKNFLNDQHYDTSWTRLGIEATNQFDLRQGKSFQIKSSLNGRSNIEDKESQLGLVSQSGITYSDHLGLSVTGIGQYLWNHDQQTVDNIGVRGTFNYDSNQDNLGTLISLAPSWNFNHQTSFNGLVEPQLTKHNVYELVQNDTETSLHSEVGYGIEIVKDWSTFTPYSGLELYNSGNQSYRFGSKLKVGNNSSLVIENSYNVRENENNENIVKLNSKIQW